MEEIIVFTAIFASVGFLAYKYAAPLLRKKAAEDQACASDCGCADAGPPHARQRGRA